MATEKWSALSSTTTYLSTELNSLANAGNKLGGAIDNSDGAARYIYMDLELYVAAQGSARSNGGFVAVYLLPSIDGSNYSFGDDSTDPSFSSWLCSFALDASTSARYVAQTNIVVPPTSFKLLVENNTGQALASSGSTLKVRFHNIEVA